MKRALIYLLVATMFAACARDNVKMDGVETIQGTIADFDVVSRVELNGNIQTVWNENDEICVFHDNEIKTYRFTGKTGDRSGSFTLVASEEQTTDGIVFDQYYAIYPVERKIRSNATDGTPLLFTTVPTVQQYKQGSYALHANTMVGTSENGKEFEFINVLGYLHLSITGDKVVKSIEIESNRGEIIAGNAYFVHGRDVRTNNYSERVITIDCGEGVQLTDQPTDFYCTVIPQTLKQGFTVTINFTDGSIFPKSTAQEITIDRNTMLTMSRIDTAGDIAWQTITINHTGTKVSAPLFNGGVDLSGIIYWGDNFMTRINKVSSYTYTDSEASHTITTKTVDANSMHIDNCTGISVIDLTKF